MRITLRLVLGAFPLFVYSVLAVFLALAIFDYPAADDFCYAAKVQSLGFLPTQLAVYLEWNGRYTATALISLFSLFGDLSETYPWVALLTLCATWGSWFLLLRAMGHGFWSGRNVATAAGVITVLTIAGTPDPAQTYYWLAGAATYQAGNVLLITLCALLWRWETNAPEYRPLGLGLACGGLVVLIAGTNEVSFILCFAILVLGLAWSAYESRSSVFLWLGLCLLALAFGLLAGFAPGNATRLSNVAAGGTLRPQPWLAALLYLPWVALRVAYWLSNVGLWASAAMIVVLTLRPARDLLYDSEGFKRSWLWLPATWLAGILVLNLIGFLANRHPLPERAESVVYLLFLLGWYPSFLIVAHAWLGDKLNAIPGWVLPASKMLLLLSLLGSPTVFEGYKDFYRGYRYRQELDARFEHIRSARASGEEAIVVQSLSRPPRTLFATELSTDSNDFRNQCLAEYFGLVSIRLGAP